MTNSTGWFPVCFNFSADYLIINKVYNSPESSSQDWAEKLEEVPKIIDGEKMNTVVDIDVCNKRRKNCRSLGFGI